MLADPVLAPGSGAAQAARSTSLLLAAGAASLAAGAVHAAAAGAHGEHRQAAVIFIGLAVAQLVWGGLVIARGTAPVVWIGIGLGIAAMGGWVVAKTMGLPVDGLTEPEPVQLADASAALFAALATVLAAASWWWSSVRLQAWAVVTTFAVLGAVGMVATSGHEHQGEGHTLASTGHAHAVTQAHTQAHSQAHTVPYDPALPIDLSGTPGVTPRQQAAAENLVAVTLSRLPQWADASRALRSGFHSIGDGFTGTEHLINQAFLTDGTTLDPDRPESLVYDTTGGGRRLVAAMYMLSPGTPLAAVPDVGGALVQWHIHDNLCFSPSGFVQGITDAAGACPKGQLKPTPAPMVHVWITKHPCGPFAALEGIAGGTIAPGATRLCDHAHGSAG